MISLIESPKLDKSLPWCGVKRCLPLCRKEALIRSSTRRALGMPDNLLFLSVCWVHECLLYNKAVNVRICVILYVFCTSIKWQIKKSLFVDRKWLILTTACLQNPIHVYCARDFKKEQTHKPIFSPSNGFFTVFKLSKRGSPRPPPRLTLTKFQGLIKPLFALGQSLDGLNSGYGPTERSTK